MRGRGIVLSLFLVVGALLSGGCSRDDKDGCDGCTGDFFPPTAPDDVLSNFQVAWRQRNTDEYSKLLADDYRFYFDNVTRAEKGLPEYWGRTTDSTQVGKLFASPQVSDISVELKWSHNAAKPATEPGRERWVYYDILDVFLDVDLAPTDDNPDGVTFRVEDQRQRFYFRKGKTEGDTLSTSATAQIYYLTEWRDYGVEGLDGPSRAPAASGSSTSWSQVKTLFHN